MAKQKQKPRQISQNLVNEDIPPIRVTSIAHSDLSDEILTEFLGPSPRSIGLSWGTLPEKGSLAVLSIATSTEVLVLTPKKVGGEAEGGPSSEGQTPLLQRALCSDHFVLAFDLAPLAFTLHSRFGLPIRNGIDIQDCFGIKDRSPLRAIQKAVENTVPIYENNVAATFESLVYEPKDNMTVNGVALRAWLAQYVGALDMVQDSLYEARKVDTIKMTPQHMSLLAKFATDAVELDSRSPGSMPQKLLVKGSSSTETKVSMEQYQYRLRKGQNVKATFNSGTSSSYTMYGSVQTVTGKGATVEGTVGEGVINVSSLSRDGPTMAEAERASILLRALQGDDTLFSGPWYKKIFTTDTPEWPKMQASSIPMIRSPKPLNPSQYAAVRQMLDPGDQARAVIVQGPPGTGKTSVISAYVDSAVAAGHQGIWLTAQSNVAVRNIAKKLLDIGFLNWKLLVSKDFHEGWHEHLYTEITSRVIRSDKMSPKYVTQQLRGCQVILCTLSMLSNARIRSCGYTTHVPITTLVVDEASQIELGDYIPVINIFSKSLQKLCFVGDDKQLPPFGEEDIGGLSSIFEVAHLRPSILFLDTQYRMPPYIGDFISKAVYQDNLHSWDNHPVQSPTPSCFFVEVPHGKERPSGKSYANTSEQEAVCLLAKHFQEHNKNFKIITPYEGQRSGIENMLKEQELAWEDKCFNIDAFQGNEEDYIIISLVRTRELGFLKNSRRTNVMLTRCKKAMYICCHPGFITGVGADTLVGQMAQEFGDDAWMEYDDLLDGNI